jgi:hypothetical protein
MSRDKVKRYLVCLGALGAATERCVGLVADLAYAARAADRWRAGIEGDGGSEELEQALVELVTGAPNAGTLRAAFGEWTRRQHLAAEAWDALDMDERCELRRPPATADAT